MIVMSFCEWLILALLGGPVFFCFYNVGMAVKRMFYAKKTKACTVCPSFEDAYNDESRVNAFFYGIAEQNRIDLQAHKRLWEQAKKNRDFLLVCHALGYELVIRRISNTDIEE